MNIVGKIDKLAKAMEANFDEGRLSERWYRAKEYFNHIEDDQWDDTLRSAKAMLWDTKTYPRHRKRLYGPPRGLKF